MPNSSRQRGDYFERRTRAALEADGWLVVRSAGSLGVADLVALKDGYTPRLVSCKLTHYLPPKQRRELIAAAELAGALGILAWSEKPGWVGLEQLSRHGGTHLPMLHMPPHKRVPRKPVPDGLYPAGEQLTIPMD